MSLIKKIILLFVCIWSNWAFGHEVSLREKIGQMLIFGFQGKNVTEDSDITRSIFMYNLGGVILFDYDYQSKLYDRNIESPEQVQLLNTSLQTFTKKANKKYKRPNLPLFISVDYEGGLVTRLSEQYGFPATFSAKQLGQMSISDAKLQAESMADTLKTAGFNLDFAPDADLDVNPETSFISKKERSFSADPDMVSQYGKTFSQAFQEKKIECAYKHFPGHGSAAGDTHLGFVDVTDTWSKEELIPFVQQINEPNHCHFLMTAHVVNRQIEPSGVPATLSYKILTSLVREQYNFDGIIISDDMQMKAIAANYGLEEALTMAINAGVDMLIFGNQVAEVPQNPKEIIDIIEKQVKKGKIKKERIESAYNQIIKVKTRLL
ncbi:glycosyl hydrolase family protein (plasmid) [Legionella adelaidensis]|uniref:Glycosyl hydrolase family protein n=1 Tax=Legionella adelaidensis TaxID=45056 RepID=A0A0W0R5W6_9GAMM|nr:glycoside hydrolase family 3 N-terminal domain-containing protein [Legionella adelaidensis]KTC66479.1 glycosyl hydrolase family protein [Legionella adelaidensis]VEH86233.1 glycosyl hydrolase family protein [Legionella adelaidensis]